MGGFRVGLMDPIIAARPTVDSFTRASYLSAVASRVDSFWVPDHLNALFPRSLWKPKYCGGAKVLPTADAYLEPWTMLGHLAARNRVGRLRLGVGVTDTGRRNPAVTAQAAATLHLLTRGRAILGIGTGEREGNEPYGVDWSKPVARFEEAMATIRALWNSNGELVNRESPYFPLHNALFDLPPYRGRWPEVWIAAHGPRMLRAVGRYADGFFPGFPHSPQEYARRLEVVRSAASGAGRDPMAITPALWMTVVTGRSRSEVDEALESEVDQGDRTAGDRRVLRRARSAASLGRRIRRRAGHPPAGHGRADGVVARQGGSNESPPGNDPQRHARGGPRAGCRMARSRCAVSGAGQCDTHAAQLAQWPGRDAGVHQDPAPPQETLMS
jgi:phthiodiolone/phenolphthiodiolone dimycocerosates ketoreductase